MLEQIGHYALLRTKTSFCFAKVQWKLSGKSLVNFLCVVCLVERILLFLGHVLALPRIWAHMHHHPLQLHLSLHA